MEIVLLMDKIVYRMKRAVAIQVIVKPKGYVGLTVNGAFLPSKAARHRPNVSNKAIAPTSPAQKIGKPLMDVVRRTLLAASNLIFAPCTGNVGLPTDRALQL